MTNQFLDESFLQKKISLNELVDNDAFREVMASFSDLYRVGIRIFASNGKKLCDIQVASGPLYAYLFEFPSTRKKSTETIQTLRKIHFPLKNDVEVPRLIKCFTGLHYIVMPIRYDGDLLGRLILGPYLPPNVGKIDPRIFEIEPLLDKDKIRRLGKNVRQVPSEILTKVLKQLQKIIDVILFTSYKTVLTNQIHIESVAASYQDLQDKNAELREANLRLKELDQMKSNFLATVSHELKTPLTSVIGYSEMLADGIAGELQPEQLEFVNTILEKGENLLSMISQVLDLTKIESGHFQLHKELFDLNTVIEKSMTDVMPQMQKKQIQLSKNIADNVQKLYADPTKIGQIFTNLLSNALKFTPNKGQVKIQVALINSEDNQVQQQIASPFSALSSPQNAQAMFTPKTQQKLEIKVSDSGIGIPADKLEHIFQRFFQVDNTSTREFGGTGLGLAIVQDFVKAHDGEISVHSVLKQGTTFTILLPINTDAL